MSEENKETEGQAATAVATEPKPEAPKPRPLPPWKVLLHNDDQHDMPYVVETITMLTTLRKAEASQRMMEAHTQGVSLLLTTHRERAELYQEQFTSRGLVVTIEAGG